VAGDSTLLNRARAYDPVALAELYDLYAPAMYAYIYRRVGDAALAEDLTGELFLRMLRAIRDGVAWRKSFNAWLYRAAHNLVVDHYRRTGRTEQVPLDESATEGGRPPDKAVEQQLEAERLRRALGQLTPEQQQVLALRFGEGLTARQVGELIGKTTGAVEALQRRGLAALRRIMAPEGDGK
jgi:RNA polymerase sigma-70 factor (ECF subfamily)